MKWTPENIQSTLNAILKKHGRCNKHNSEFPCPECEAEIKAAEAENNRVEENRLREDISRREANVQAYLKRCGVRKKYLSCSFASFIGGDAVKKACMDFLINPCSIYLFGPYGCGKTHLAVCIFVELIKTLKINGENDGLFVTVTDLLLDIRDSFRNNGVSSTTEKQLVNKYSSVNYLIIDDIGAEKHTDWTESTLYTIIDRRHSNLLPTIYTSNLSLEELDSHLGPRIASRLADSKIIKITMPDFRKKRSRAQVRSDECLA